MIATNVQAVVMYGMVRSSKIIGETVVNRHGEKVGKIHEMVIDANKNRVAYAVLSSGGFPGMGNKLFAIPWEALELSVSANQFILNVDKEKLTAAPCFEESAKWPDFSDTLWEKDIYRYYNFAPPWKYDNDPGNMLIESSGSLGCSLTR